MSATQHRLNTSVGVLNERTCVAVEVDRLLRVEHHVLARVDLEQEVFQRTKTDDASDFGSFVGWDILHAFGRSFGSRVDHFVHQVVGIYDSTFAALHLAVREFYHAVREVHKVFTPLEAELVEEQCEHLEVVVLLITNDIDHLVDRIVLVAKFCCTDVLSHIDRCAIATEQELVVEAVCSEVSPDRVVLLAIHDALFDTTEHQVLTFEICV